MAPPSTIFEPDSGMPSLTKRLLRQLAAGFQICGAANPGCSRLSGGCRLKARRRQNCPPHNFCQITSLAKLSGIVLSLALLLPLAQAASIPTFAVLSDDQGGWPL